MKVLVIDIGGTSVKILASGQTEPRRFPSGPTMTPAQMVSRVKKLADEWKYDVVSIGYPGLIHRGRMVSEPYNLGPNWVGFDFEAAFGCPVKRINDAAMQALGTYKGGTMLFFGLGDRPRECIYRRISFVGRRARRTMLSGQIGGPAVNAKGRREGDHDAM